MDADTLQEIRNVRAILGSILLRRLFGLGEAAGAVERAKTILDGIVAAEQAQDATTGGGEA